MQVFFVSIRTANIYGPGEITDFFNPEPGIAILTCDWTLDYALNEWEGYAIVVPERNQVWGAAKPEYSGTEVRARFEFTPLTIPESDRKLFPEYPAPQADSDTVTEADSEAED
jgi:hypothetical protein